MAIGLVMTFDGVTQQDYENVMAAGGLDLPSPGNPNAGGSWPKGAISHSAGPTPTGWCVVDVWESQADADAFIGSTLGPITAGLGIPQPNVVPFEVYNSRVV